MRGGGQTADQRGLAQSVQHLRPTQGLAHLLELGTPACDIPGVSLLLNTRKKYLRDGDRRDKVVTCAQWSEYLDRRIHSMPTDIRQIGTMEYMYRKAVWPQPLPDWMPLQVLREAPPAVEGACIFVSKADNTLTLSWICGFFE